MSNRRFWLASLSGLIIIGLLILGGYALYTTAWSQGYALGQLEAGREGQAATPYMPLGFGFPGPLCALSNRSRLAYRRPALRELPNGIASHSTSSLPPLRAAV